MNEVAKWTHAALAVSIVAGCSAEQRGHLRTTRVHVPPVQHSAHWPPSAEGPVEIVVEENETRPSATTEVPAPPEDENALLRVREGESQGLYFLEVVSGGAGFDDELPMVVVIHGRGDMPRPPGGPFYGVELPMRIIMPRAPDPLDEGFTWLPVRYADHQDEVLAASLRNVAARLAAMVDELRSERPTKGLPIVTGFSQGGMITLALVVLHPNVVGAAFPFASWLPPQLVPTQTQASPIVRRDLQIRSVHGLQDSVIPVGPTRELVPQLRALGFDIELHVFPRAEHVMTPEMNDLFHAWLLDAVRAQGENELPVRR